MTAPLSPQCATYITCNMAHVTWDHHLYPCLACMGFLCMRGASCAPRCAQVWEGLTSARQNECYLCIASCMLIIRPKPCALLFFW